MMRILVAVLLLAPLMVQAKRTPPPKIEPVVHEGVKYVAPNDNGHRGYVQAWEVATNQKLWEVTIYRNTIDPLLESDVQWVFIKSLKLQDGKLLVVNERNVAYTLDLKTKEVKKLDKKP